MAVDFDTFLSWAKDRFGADAVKIKHTGHGDEILTHSFYAHRQGMDDYTFNLWMSPSGGKGKRNPEKGSFRCWKTDTMGTLVKLVSDYDRIDYEEAEEILCGGSSLRQLELKVHEFFGSKPEESPVEVEEPVRGLCLPDNCYLIDKMEEWNALANIARNYLAGRKIPTKGLYLCTEHEEYGGRIVIPYFDRDGNLIWYNCRTPFDKKSVIKYLKCKSDGLNITQEDVLYVPAWPRPGEKLYIMEGEIDAMSMRMAGLYACAIGGKFMSDTQIEMIRQYVPVLAFDADEGGFKKDSGLQALINVGTQLLEKGFPKVTYVRPPKVYKDWNKLLVERDAQTVKAYAERFEKPFTSSTPDMLLAQRL
jgi:hypothetical protein